MALCGAAWCIIQAVSINQAACCPSSSRSGRAKPLSAINLHQNTERKKKNTHTPKGTKVQRDGAMETTRKTHTHTLFAVQGIMWGRWSKILIRSRFALFIITSMHWRSGVCFVHSREGENKMQHTFFYCGNCAFCLILNISHTVSLSKQQHNSQKKRDGKLWVRYL